MIGLRESGWRVLCQPPNATAANRYKISEMKGHVNGQPIVEHCLYTAPAMAIFPC